MVKKAKKQLQPKIKPAVKEQIRANTALMNALMDRWDIRTITIYQWLQKDFRKLFLNDSLTIIESYLKIDRNDFVENLKS